MSGMLDEFDAIRRDAKARRDKDMRTGHGCRPYSNDLIDDETAEWDPPRIDEDYEVVLGKIT